MDGGEEKSGEEKFSHATVEEVLGTWVNIHYQMDTWRRTRYGQVSLTTA